MPVDSDLQATIDGLIRVFGSNATVEARRMADRLSARNEGEGTLWQKAYLILRDGLQGTDGGTQQV